ncbi:hypothetical protein QL285_076721 [Trifolium repens]|nr:hypothetical protein QL285_076721 [Trifolium repens]
MNGRLHNGPQQGHRSTMRPSCCDVKIRFIFITDPVHFISLGAKLLHRATIAHIVLRWKIFFRFIVFDFLANKQLPSMGAIVLRWNADFFPFLGFFLSFRILDSVLMLFLAFVGFSSYLGLSWSFYY